MIETIYLAHMPPSLILFATLYRNVSNTSYLREQLLAGNTDFEYAFIDASTVVSRAQVLGAAFRATNDYVHHRLKSKNVHSEIVFSLSPNNNIGEAFRRFGIGETTRDLIVLKVVDVALASQVTTTVAKSVESHLAAQVKGTLVPFNDVELASLTDLVKVRKVYKLPAALGGKQLTNGAAGEEAGLDEKKALEVQILGLIALRGAT